MSEINTTYGSFMPGDLIKDRYFIVRKISEGGMGSVYLAQDRVHAKIAGTDAGSYVSIKSPKSEVQRYFGWEKAFFGEYTVGFYLSHMNLVKSLYFDSFKDQPFFVMEYVPGRLMSEVLGNNKLTHSDDQFSLVRQLVSAIFYCHRMKVVHGDLKPKNLLLSEQGLLKIFDFGSSQTLRPLDELPYRINLNAFEVFSKAYAAPEVRLGQVSSIPSDIFSICTLIYEMFTGELPYSGYVDWDFGKLKNLERQRVKPVFGRGANTLDRLLQEGLTLNPKERLNSLNPFVNTLFKLPKRRLMYSFPKWA